ncbi:MAG: TaqI-like C-terminal specificity domain-containing protein, partial [Candidatus Binataceae bacterium]
SMLIPYSLDGRLLAEQKLGAMKSYLSQPQRMQQLQGRTCVRRKPWYAFHETPPLSEILRPKILCKDITARPRFWIDRSGALVPRHSVYYLVPREPGEIHKLCEYLNSEAVREWLSSHCQRAANGFLRLQSSILKKLPIPESIAMRAKPGQIREHGSRSRRNNSDARTRTFEFAG